MRKRVRHNLLALCLGASLVAIASASPQSPAQETPAPKPSPKRKINVSAEVAQGLLLHKVQPAYPEDAKAAGVTGTVVLRITISTEGIVEEVSVVSGPEQLQQAAMDAVKQWRYKPYLIKEEPVEVGTTVNMVFSLTP